MRHLTRELRAFGSKAGATAVAATLAVGGVAAAQTGEPTSEPTATEEPAAAEDEAEAEDEDATEAAVTDQGDDRQPDDGTEVEDAPDGEADGPDEVPDDEADAPDDERPDDGVDRDDDAASDAVVDAPADADDDRPGRRRGHERREQRGSATSERVHEALTLDGVLRPGDEGWGAAVSESARAGGHGQRVSRAARGEGPGAGPSADPGAAPAGGTSEREDVAAPTGAPGRSGQAPGRNRDGR